MAPKVRALSLLALPECVYEHIIAMSGDWRARYRAMAKLELAAKACGINASMWRRMVLQQLKEIKDVDWERLLLLFPIRRTAYKEQASRWKNNSARTYDLTHLLMATARDDVSNFVHVLRKHPEALTQIVWDSSDINFAFVYDHYEGVDRNFISYMFEVEDSHGLVSRPYLAQPRTAIKALSLFHDKDLRAWEWWNCKVHRRCDKTLDNERNRAPCVETHGGTVERKLDICTFVERLAQRGFPSIHDPLPSLQPFVPEWMAPTLAKAFELRKEQEMVVPLKIAAHLYSAAALE